MLDNDLRVQRGSSIFKFPYRLTCNEAGESVGDRGEIYWLVLFVSKGWSGYGVFKSKAKVIE